MRAAVFLLAFFVFWASPHRPIGDWQYAMLESQSVLEHGSFALERYFPDQGWTNPDRPWFDLPWQLFQRDGHVYYAYPPGAPVLSLPLVALGRLLGWSAVTAEGRYDPVGELQLQAFVASALMAGLAALIYASGRLMLPRRYSLAIAFAAAFGSAIYSSASRGVWGHTGELVLNGLLVHLLLRQELRGRPARLELLGVLGGALYVMRPTGLVSFGWIGLYLLGRRGLAVWRYAAGAALPLGLFVAWSQAHFGQPLPPYYLLAGQVGLASMPAGLAGTLISPSRGLLVFSPALLWVFIVLLHRAKEVPCKPLAGLALAIAGSLQLAIAGWPGWWGGQSYGARLSTSLLPWLILLAILASRAEVQARATSGPGLAARIRAFVGWLLIGLGILMNAPGAWSARTSLWNQTPFVVDFWPELRLWNWKRPQPLAALGWPLDWDYPAWPQPPRLLLGEQAAQPFLWGGWGEFDQGRRWTSWPHSELLFTWTPGQSALLRFRVEPWPAADGTVRQKLELFLNDRRIRDWDLLQAGPRLLHVRLPGRFLQQRNRLRFHTPNALPVPVKPPHFGIEHRGIGLWWIELFPIPDDPASQSPRPTPESATQPATAPIDPQTGQD